MSNEHEKVAEALNNVDPNAEYETQESQQEEVEPSQQVGPGHQVAGPEEGGESSEDGEETFPAAAAYEPDYRYTVRGEQKEFDDWAKKFIVDKTVEDNFRDLVTKAAGIEEIKEARDRYKTQYEEVIPEYQKLTHDLGRLAHYRNNRQWDSFFKTLGMNEDEVLQYAQQRLHYQDLTPQQRQEYDNYVNSQEQQYDNLTQNDLLRNQVQTLMQQNREREVQLVMSRPEIQEFAQSFDQRMGKEGAFKEEVWNRGKYHAMVNKTDIGAEQAVNEVLKMVGVGQLGASQMPQSPQAPNMSNPAGPPQPAMRPPTIPKVQASGASPTQISPRSISDLRKIRAERFGS